MLNKGISNRDLRDRTVYKKVFDRFYRELVAYAHNFLYDLQASEDVVQDIFIQLWENSDQLEIHTSLKSYLYTAVRNKCYNQLRGLKLQDDLNLIELNASLSTEYDMDGHDRNEKQQIYRQVMDIVDGFPEAMRHIFQLRFLEQYKYAEIAEELGISVNSVKTQLKRAKSKINKAIVILGYLLFHFY